MQLTLMHNFNLNVYSGLMKNDFYFKIIHAFREWNDNVRNITTKMRSVSTPEVLFCIILNLVRDIFRKKRKENIFAKFTLQNYI